MSDDQVLEGGCACGSIRYRVSARPEEAGFCHCRICQKTTGAPLLAWAVVAIDAFAYTRGEPCVYKSSPWGERRFCPTCGTQLEYRESDSPRYVELNYAALDCPALIQPSRHIWCASTFPGLVLGDDLPKYDGDG